jgi:hypothetical protein
MLQILDWLKHNKEWVFSGVGVAIIAAIYGFIKLLALLGHQRLRVGLSFGLISHGPRLSDQMLLFKVANPTEKVIQITSITIPLKGGSNLIFPSLAGEKQLPCAVDPGHNIKFWIEVSEVKRSLMAHGYVGRVKVRAVVSDALDGEHKSNYIRINL